MRNVRTINLAVVSRRDLYYVSENKSFCFGQIFMGEKYFQEFGPIFYVNMKHTIWDLGDLEQAWHAIW